jgi:hypothetical protein
MEYRVFGKVELPRKNLGDNAEGIVAQKVWLDLKAFDEDGELDNEEVIAADLAHKTRLGFRHEDGTEYFYEGVGAMKDKNGKIVRFTSGPAKGKAKPADGYILDGPGISAIEHSNGFRLVQNFKKLPPGYYTAFGEVDGVAARFKQGDTFRVGRAKPRPKGHR